ncbi:secretory carrier-associated membrane protein 3 [Thecamonas trahens ATCC 50062]|uniref:Secretory carrier-associated membrane protein 3 n=1 Tax=Thecamonas trahens ATCC 50062 TaxID=461836 RepID=A0A0L0DKH5_THETB|nr:secretory carrier-associated membrane protein 3 [Thecamonas trahens ATCC 50062]KNC52551.1 secretory carrier-associated membrane protein 3 [Thecamonas trahens ATCC 50062]|eukprot:XP_013755341.1 secretory carrier-associated membrane protein 3 [Thecamonas trahens ATCC 50062]
MVRMTYIGWYILVLCYVMNWISLIAVMISNFDGAGNTAMSFGLACIMMIIGIPISFAGWYRPLYNGARTGKSSLFVWFFFAFSVHILLCCFWALGIPSTGSAGLIIALTAYGKDDPTSGTLCLFTGFAWGICAVWSLLRIYRAHQYYLSRSMSASSAKHEVATAAARASV